MNKIFPKMFSKPEKIQIFSLIPCWIGVFVLVPMYMPILGLGLWEQWEISAWLEIGYHVIVGVAMFLVMLGYLKEEWFIEAEIIHVGHQDIRGCIACGSCGRNGKCVFDDLVNEVAEKLEGAEQLLAEKVAEHGGRTFFVGGFVRDRLMGKENKDIDIEIHGISPEVLENILNSIGKT